MDCAVVHAVLHNQQVTKLMFADADKNILHDEADRNITVTLAGVRGGFQSCLGVTTTTTTTIARQQKQEVLFAFSSRIDKSKALSLLLHTADISHPSKPWALHSRWTKSLMEEFFQQVGKLIDLDSQVVSQFGYRSTQLMKEVVSVGPRGLKWDALVYGRFLFVPSLLLSPSNRAAVWHDQNLWMPLGFLTSVSSARWLSWSVILKHRTSCHRDLIEKRLEELWNGTV